MNLDRYDAGLLSAAGGGDVNWWWDYLRCELDRAHDFYQSQVSKVPDAPAPIDPRDHSSISRFLAAARGSV